MLPNMGTIARNTLEMNDSYMPNTGTNTPELPKNCMLHTFGQNKVSGLQLPNLFRELKSTFK